MLTKYATVEDVQVLEIKGSPERIAGAGLDKLSSYEDYRTDDGYLYTRVRAISSRVNKNHDGWPSEELAKAYLTFIGKPIFVDHNNSDPTRARGVIVDAKLHIEDDLQKASALDPYYASAPENHKPPTWIELLLEVDAKAYPKLAAAIVADDIDGVSMGANVERSRCSHCQNIATTPEEYCQHVMNKGATYDKYDDFGRKTASPSYEDCYDIGFFEISYVFDPADPTALDMGGKRHASVEAGGKKKIKPSVKNKQNKDRADRQRNDAEQAAFNEQQRKVRERSNEFAQRDWDENKSFFSKPGEDYEVPAAAPEGGALGNPKPPTDGGWDVEKKNWVDPSKTPSTVSPVGETFTTVACPECLGGVNRANCPTCEGKGQIPQEKGPLQVPEQVQADPLRQQVIDQAAQVPDDVRNQRVKQYKRVKPNRFQGSFFEKTATIDMGGFTDTMPSSAAGSGSPAPSPVLPGAQAQNCPQCGGAMENGVCPQCTAQAAGSDVGAGGPTGQQHQQPMASFKIAAGGQVHYSEEIPPHAVNMEWDTADETPPAEVQGLADGMAPGMTAEDKASRAVGMTQSIPEAVDLLMNWGMHPDMAYAYAEAAERQQGGEPLVKMRDMPDDPFLASFKIAKDGSVHYAEQAPLPQSMLTTAPEAVDTLRQEKVCEVCGSDMDDGKCEVCNYEEPPEGFDNPDLQKAQEIAEMGAMDGGGGAPGGAPGEPPPGVMAPPQGGGGAPGAGGAPPGAAMSSTRKSSETPALTNEHTAGKIRQNEQTILPATKTVSDHPKTTQVVKEPTRLTQSNTKATMTQIPTKAQVAAEMVRRGTFGVKTASEAEALLDEKGIGSLLAASPASDPAEHHQDVTQVGGDVSNPESDTAHIDVTKQVDIEKIPTKTWNGEADQHQPVTPEAGDLGGPIGDTLASVKTADGQSGVLGDPTNAEKQIDVNKPLQPEFNVGPDTQTFKSDDFHVGDPVTTEDGNSVGGPIGETLSRTQIVAHVLSALKIAEEMVEQGLVNEEQKFELAAQLEQEAPEELAVRRDMLSKTRTAGFRTQRTAPAAQKLARIVNSSRDTGVKHDIEDDNIGDSALFGR